MTINLYSAAFDFARMSLAGSGVLFSGAITGSFAPDTQLYFHGNVTDSVGAALLINGKYTSTFVTDLMAGYPGALAGTDQLIVSSVASDMYYTLSSNLSNNFAVTWNGALGIEIRDILGFEINLTGSNSYTSTKRPKYIIGNVIPNNSQVHEAYEPSGRANYVESDAGNSYSILPSQLPTYRDWIQPFESDPGPTDAQWTANIGIGGAPVHIPLDYTNHTKIWWTWEDFYKYVRASIPFQAVDSSIDGVYDGWIYTMRGDNAHWDPTRVTADFNGHWNMPFKCRRIVYGDMII